METKKYNNYKIEIENKSKNELTAKKYSKLYRNLVATCMSLVMIFSFSVQSYAISDDVTIEESTQYFQTVLTHILSSYYGDGYEDLTAKILLESAINGMFSELDPYSIYYTAEEFAKYISTEDGKSYGLGVIVSSVSGGVIVNSVIEGSGAEAAGIKANDIIIKVDGLDLAGLTLQQTVTSIQGEKGTKATVIVNRAGNLLEFSVERCELKNNPVKSLILSEVTGEESDSNTIYLHIERFNGNATEFFNEEMEKYEDKDITKIILDLRNNPGGYLDQALKICSFFLEKGERIVSLKDKEGNESIYTSKNDGQDFEIVALINGNSASATELTAAALSENNKAILVGESTYGKNVAQNIFRYAGLSYKFTVEEYFTPNGNSLREVGVAPDVMVEMPTYLYDIRNKYYGGEESNDILAVKSMLKFLGYEIGDETAIYDDITMASVVKFQADNGLGAYGGIDYTTQRKLNEVAYIKASQEDYQFNKAVEIIRDFDTYKEQYLNK